MSQQEVEDALKDLPCTDEARKRVLEWMRSNDMNEESDLDSSELSDRGSCVGDPRKVSIMNARIGSGSTASQGGPTNGKGSTASQGGPANRKGSTASQGGPANRKGSTASEGGPANSKKGSTASQGEPTNRKGLTASQGGPANSKKGLTASQGGCEYSGSDDLLPKTENRRPRPPDNSPADKAA